MKRLRILSLIETLYCSGGEYRLLNLARHIDRVQFDHKIVCLKQETDEFARRYGSLRDKFVEAGSEIIDFQFENFRAQPQRNTARWLALGTKNFAAAVTRVCRLIENLGVDVIDGHLAAGNRIGAMAGVITRTPAMVTTYLHQERFSPPALYYISQQMAFHMANGIMTDAERTRDDIKKWMLRPRASFFVVPNGAAPPAPEMPRDDIFEQFDIPKGRTIVGMIARAVPSKGQLVFLRAAKAIIERHPNCFFLIVGFVRGSPPYTYRDEILRLAEELGLSDHVRIFGYYGAIGDIWQLIDIHVHPALEESLPDAIIQGMSLQKPQVVTDVGGISSMVQNGVTGFVVPPNQPLAIADAVSHLIGAPELARRFGDAAYDRYLQGYTGEAMARGIENALTDLVHSARRAC